ncbi:hypothetical protein LCGC14_2474330 [marine sediment metagenome]|uniref:Uncharacterized protein n=1 Tax=marine sediment metagenome TaxID=412755 RepID=A0A0F9B9C1_9ZZZZ
MDNKEKKSMSFWKILSLILIAFLIYFIFFSGDSDRIDEIEQRVGFLQAKIIDGLKDNFNYSENDVRPIEIVFPILDSVKT